MYSELAIAGQTDDVCFGELGSEINITVHPAWRVRMSVLVTTDLLGELL